MPAPARPTLPLELWTLVLSSMSLEDRLQASLACQLFAAAAQASVRGVAVQLQQPTRAAVPTRLLSATSTSTLALLSPGACAAADSPAAAAAQASCWEPHDQQLWQPAGGSRLRPAAAAWHLRRAAALLTSGTAQRPLRHRLTLQLTAPELDASTAELQRMLETAGAEAVFAAVSVPLGLLRLDGALSERLVRCNARAATLPSTLQAPVAYSALERLALQLSLSDDLPAALASLTHRALPALSCLALLASEATTVPADLAQLAHSGITRLDLHGVLLPAGFPSLQHLSGLRTLAVRYDEEDEAPPLNLQGDLSALSTLKQLSHLSLDGLVSGEGLQALTQLTSLRLTPQQGARIQLRGLPLLRQLSLDLSAGSCGRDLLSASCASVHVPATVHGLGRLERLELRCFVWHDRQSGDGEHTSSGASSSSSSSSSDEETEEEGVDADDGSSSSGEEGDEAASAASGWDDEQVGDEEADSSSSEAEDEPDAGSEAAESEADDDNEEEEAQMAGGGFQDGAAAEHEEPPAQPGLLEASWGFLHQQHVRSGAGQQATALAALEHRYIAALLARLPTLTHVQFIDCLGWVEAPGPHGSKPGAAAAVASGALGGGNRAGTPGLLGATPVAAASGLQGWHRAVTETPVPGGISQFDLGYSRCC